MDKEGMRALLSHFVECQADSGHYLCVRASYGRKYLHANSNSLDNISYLIKNSIGGNLIAEREVFSIGSK